MITVTRLKGEKLVVNAHLIEVMESTPDTIIGLTTGKKIIVQETVDELVDKIVVYHRMCSPFSQVVGSQSLLDKIMESD